MQGSGAAVLIWGSQDLSWSPPISLLRDQSKSPLASPTLQQVGEAADGLLGPCQLFRFPNFQRGRTWRTLYEVMEATEDHRMYDSPPGAAQHRRLWRDRKWMSGCQWGDWEGVRAQMFVVYFGDNENVLKWIMVMDTQLCDYTKRH